MSLAAPYLCRSYKGFTLAELLIALAILGVIATFAIPKILTSQQTSKYNAMSKEAMAAIAQAFQIYTKSNAIDAGTHPEDFFLPYLNYVSIDTSGTIDNGPATGTPTQTCAVGYGACFRLASGGVLRATNCGFGGTTAQYATRVTFDPDGVATGNQDSVIFYIYTTGRITTKANVDPNTLGGGGCGATWPSATADPAWFSL